MPTLTLDDYSASLQQIADTLFSLFDLAVTVANTELRLVAVAGTDATVGATLSPDSPHAESQRLALKVVIPSPGRHRVCAGCCHRTNCPFQAELLVPIQDARNVYGSVAITASSPQRRRRITEQHSLILRVTELLLASVTAQIEAARLSEACDHATRQLQQVMDLTAEGIALTDLNGSLERYNHNLVVTLGLNIDELRTANLLTLFGAGKKEGWGQEISRRTLFQVDLPQHPGIEGTVTPVSIRGRRCSLLWQLKKLDEIRARAGTSATAARNFTFDDIKGVSAPLVEVKEQARLAASSDSTILITGESGTGKEVFARAIHNASRRRSGPFVAINCAAIPETLLESELFGYDEGAFSGARRGGKKGRFELANGGTLFLDEIGDMSVDLQAKLLRVLQSRTIEHVGSVSTTQVDVRVIAATNQNIEDLILHGRFRRDLYYRLNVIPLVLPPLRERKEDLYILLDFFMKRYSLLLGKEPKQFTAEALNLLFRYDFRGNIRELENAVEYIMNLEIGHLVTPSSLPEPIRGYRAERATPAFTVSGASAELCPIEELIDRCVLAAIQKYGSSTEGKRTAAQALGVSLATLYRRLKRLGSQVDKTSQTEKYPVRAPWA